VEQQDLNIRGNLYCYIPICLYWAICPTLYIRLLSFIRGIFYDRATQS